jgi:hypothetical protein
MNGRKKERKKAGKGENVRNNEMKKNGRKKEC